MIRGCHTPKSGTWRFNLMIKKDSPSDTWVEINLAHLKSNYQAIRQKAKPSTGIMAIVKADAYGHGLVPVAQALTDEGVSALGVASIAEGIQIRRKVDNRIPVILLLGCLPEETASCLHYGLTPILYSLETACKLDQEAGRRRKSISVHLKIDTGMGRLGIPWTQFREFLSKIRGLRHITVTGLASHFGQADVKSDYNSLQSKRFGLALKEAQDAGIKLSENHMANSAALIHFRSSHLHYVRPGILLYGGSPNGQPRGLRLKPVMTLKSRILQIKDVPAGVEVSYGGTYVTPRPETLAIIPVGYANGYPRSLSSKSSVLIRGRKFPLLGRVCMNLIVVRVDKALSLEPGEEVVLMGSQGQEAISAAELARQADTISYELFCSLGRMNPRKYL
jgi:alanine racemase